MGPALQGLLVKKRRWYSYRPSFHLNVRKLLCWAERSRWGAFFGGAAHCLLAFIISGAKSAVLTGIPVNEACAFFSKGTFFFILVLRNLVCSSVLFSSCLLCLCF